MVLWLYLLIHNGADQLSDRCQWLVTGVKGHRLPGESNLEQKGHTVNGAPWVCAVGGRLAAIRKPAAKCGRRAGGRWWCGRGHVMRGGKERAWGCRGWAVVGRHWALFVMLSGQQRGIKWKRLKKKTFRFSQSNMICPSVSFVRGKWWAKVPPHWCITEAKTEQERFWNRNLTSGFSFPK